MRRSFGRSAGRHRSRSTRGCATRSSGTGPTRGGGGRSRSRIRPSSRTTRRSTKRAADVPILVTGAAGFAGSYVIEALAGSGDTIGWTHRSSPPGEVTPLAAWERVDLLNPAEVRDAIARIRPSAVIHCAGAPNVAHSWRDTLTPLSINVLATHHLFDALRRAGVPCRVIVPGSATVYAPASAAVTEGSPVAPSNPYAVSKLAQEDLSLRAAREDAVGVIVTRSVNHTGPRQRSACAAPNMARQIAQIEAGPAQPPIKGGNPQAPREFPPLPHHPRAYGGPPAPGKPSTLLNQYSCLCPPIA